MRMIIYKIFDKENMGGFFMKKVAVVYWSGSGNTEEMAKAVLEGARKGAALGSSRKGRSKPARRR